MGKEARCTAHYQGRSSEGKALLETHELLFRGDFRLAVKLAEAKDVRADDGQLALTTPGGELRLELGAQAAKWAKAILSPPTLLDKLGVKADHQVAFLGSHPAEFVGQVETLTGRKAARKLEGKPDLIFFEASAREALEQFPRLKKAMAEDGAIWVIRPRGHPAISERDVMTAGRDAGLKDVKVAAFSSTHTAEKFVIPVTDRPHAKKK